jgi:hypothetical protein
LPTEISNFSLLQSIWTDSVDVLTLLFQKRWWCCRSRLCGRSVKLNTHPVPGLGISRSVSARPVCVYSVCGLVSTVCVDWCLQCVWTGVCSVCGLVSTVCVDLCLQCVWTGVYSVCGLVSTVCVDWCLQCVWTCVYSVCGLVSTVCVDWCLQCVWTGVYSVCGLVSTVCAQEVKNQHHLGFRRTYGVLDRKWCNMKLRTFGQSVELNTVECQREIIRKLCTVIAILVLLYGFEPWTLKKKRQ